MKWYLLLSLLALAAVAAGCGCLDPDIPCLPCL